MRNFEYVECDFLVDPEHELRAMLFEQECKAAWIDEDGEDDSDTLIIPHIRHIPSAKEWNAILGGNDPLPPAA